MDQPIQAIYSQIMAKSRELRDLIRTLPASRSQSLAVTKLEEAALWIVYGPDNLLDWPTTQQRSE
jgi:hypothetical protein